MTVSRFNFRVWDKEDKYFLPRAFIDKDGMVLYYYRLATFHMGNPSIRVETIYLDEENYVLMQSTGLVDMNGKEIFEGDFLKDDETGDILNVQWREDGACFGVSINENWQDYDWRDFGELDMYDLESLEIIGNEYENPELLKR